MERDENEYKYTDHISIRNTQRNQKSGVTSLKENDDYIYTYTSNTN